ncbi:hypothetical protein [Nocardia sp. NPDC127526]|uniref:hypothetical protein n=1 Tax=Nocardia sp. NPDC127526 TaxID=3345393 RepID=UPI0036318228
MAITIEWEAEAADLDMVGDRAGLTAARTTALRELRALDENGAADTSMRSGAAMTAPQGHSVDSRAARVAVAVRSDHAGSALTGDGAARPASKFPALWWATQDSALWRGSER